MTKQAELAIDPRNVGEMTCRTCDFAAPCLQNASIDPAQPPAGFRVGGTHEELSQTTA